MAKLTNSPRLNYLLGQMGIFTPYQVVNHLPRRYENNSYTLDRNLTDKQRVVLLGKVISLPKETRARNINIVTFDFMTNSKAYFKVVFFNQPYLSKTVKLDETYTLIGSYNLKRNEIDGTSIYKGEMDKNRQIKAIYTLPQDYANNLFSGLVNRSLEAISNEIYNIVPKTFVSKYRLVNKSTALKWAHFPEDMEQVRQSLRHLKYEEALLFSLKNAVIREDNKSFAKIKNEPIDLTSCEPLLKTLLYKLTEDQQKACEEIIEDMNQSSLMYRLLQGDVGTGKTLVCFVALYANYVRGNQGALMAPTDVLARQHYENALKIFKDTKLRIALLLGSTSQKEKEQIYRDLEDGYIDLVIGTHALFSKSVKYSSLGLAVIDEQHRFGVNQRITLANKGEHADLLMMSATPIPRSLALSIFGDLDISTLYTFPSKARDVKTTMVKSDDESIFISVDKALQEHKQVYVIAPLIDFSTDERYSVDKLFSRYVLRYKDKVGLVHGKLKQEEKENALNNFYNGTTPILVSTQVIEVGIDVKSANTMIIYDASNFGLASLHQLRGRIGRDGSKATCILTNDEDDDETKEKLEFLCHNEDGFKIAEYDLKMRGPGELTGVKQSGIPDFTFLNVVDDFKIFTVARDDAQFIMKNKKNDEFKFILSYARKQVENDQSK